MRLAVILTACVLKFYLWSRLMTRRETLIAALVLILVLGVGFYLKIDHKRPVQHPDVFCNYPTPPHIDFPDCQFKLRDARSAHSAPMRPSVA